MKKILGSLVFFIFMVASANAFQVLKQNWIQGMTTALPVAFCRDEQYFRQCFDVSQQECEKVVASATRVCIQRYEEELPDQLNQPEDGMHWGTIIGQCVGETYEAALTQEKINIEKCNIPENWI